MTSAILQDSERIVIKKKKANVPPVAQGLCREMFTADYCNIF